LDSSENRIPKCGKFFLTDWKKCFLGKEKEF